jgi:hypothetical protein
MMRPGSSAWSRPGHHALGLPPNANNDVMRRGCEQLGYRWA